MFRLTEAQYKQLQRGEAPGAASKHRNVKTVVDGIRFDSGLEAKHWRELQIRQAAGEIRHLERQVPFPFTIAGVEIGRYVSDYEYEERQGTAWVPVVEDAKSPVTRRLASYRLKRKLMQALYGITIREILAPTRRARRIRKCL